MKKWGKEEGGLKFRGGKMLMMTSWAFGPWGPELFFKRFFEPFSVFTVPVDVRASQYINRRFFKKVKKHKASSEKKPKPEIRAISFFGISKSKAT